MQLNISDHELPWFKIVRFPYDKRMVEYLKQFPGTSWDAKNKCWIVPIEVLEWMQRGDK